jgi:predicted transcriptional regulator
MAKRGKLEIMQDILKLIKDSRNSIKATPLLRKSKLSSVRFKQYYSDLLNIGLIKEFIDKDKSKYVVLTEKGFSFLEKYKTIISFIEEFEL